MFSKIKAAHKLIISYLMLCMQILPTIALLSISSASYATDLPHESDSVGDPVPASQPASEVIASMGSNYAAENVEQWLQQFGTARVQLDVDEHGKWDSSAVDFLAPLYTTKNLYVFTQLGFRAPDDRKTGNLGLGVRKFTEKWMYGGNLFFDNDFTGHNRRMGLGAEAWTDYVKLTANTYIGLNDWHDSRDFDDFYEKPASGFDVRTEGYIPSLPQLGAKIIYEKYYGDDVALFDKDYLQSNPSAITLGLNFTPVPLVTAGIDYRHGQDSMDETKFSLNFRYSFGQPLKDQLSPSAVAHLRQLDGSRYELVDRNNEIILQYKKKSQNNELTDLKLDNTKDNSPADGLTSNVVTLQAVTESGRPVKNALIHWSNNGHAKLSAATGITDSNGQTSVQLTNTYSEQIDIQASSGTVVRTIRSSFVPYVASLNLALTQNNAQANGSMQDTGKVTVKDISGKVMSGVPIDWNVDNGAVIVSSDSSTDKNGNAEVHFSNKKTGNVTLKATALGKSESVVSTFIQQNVANIGLTLSSTTAPAGGTKPITTQALVTDDDGIPIPGVQVQWETTGSAKVLSSSTTNEKGIASTSIQDAKAEVVQLKATSGAATASQTVTFTAGAAASLALSLDTSTAIADGTSPVTASATVTDAQGNPVADGTEVTWGAEHATPASGTSTTTGGVATTTFTSTSAGPDSLKATSGDATASQTVTFTAGAAANVEIKVPSGTLSVPADGVTIIAPQAIVTDARGNPVADGTEVTWGATHAQPKEAVVLTKEGVATNSFTSTTVGPDTLKATVNGVSSTQDVTYTPVTFGSLQFTTPVPTGIADGLTPITVTVTLKDSQGNLLRGQTITWSKTQGHVIPGDTSSVTDDNGVATMTYTDNQPEQATLMATYGSGHNATAAVRFTRP